MTETTGARFRASDGRSAAARVVLAAGIIAVVLALWNSRAGLPAWSLVAAGVGVAGWIALTIAPLPAHPVLSLVALGAATVGGAVAALPTQLIGIVPAVIAIVTAFSRPARPIAVGVVTAALTAAVVGAVAAVTSATPVLLLSALAVSGGGVLVGSTRRQSRIAAERERSLAAERLALQTERARSASAQERARIARDLHDTLAHALGGLVVQLDAVEALAEAGRFEDATGRVRWARALAAEGLAEARRAVEALREVPSGPVPLPVVAAAIQRTVTSGGNSGVTLDIRLDPVAAITIAADSAEALERTAQEALTNARKHAPGKPVRVSITAGSAGAQLRVENAHAHVATGLLADSGAGLGLVGMRERFDAIPGAELTIDDGPDQFSITASVPPA